MALVDKSEEFKRDFYHHIWGEWKISRDKINERKSLRYIKHKLTSNKKIWIAQRWKRKFIFLVREKFHCSHLTINRYAFDFRMIDIYWMHLFLCVLLTFTPNFSFRFFFVANFEQKWQKNFFLQIFNEFLKRMLFICSFYC